MIPGLEARDRTSFHGFTTYWMIKKVSSCTVHCVENTASHKKDSVGQCTLLTVLLGEADQTSEVPVAQWCCFTESDAATGSSTGSVGLPTAEGSSWLILMKCPVRILSWGKPCRLG